MDTQEIINKFVERMKQKGITDEEIQKTLFIANTIAVEETSRDADYSPNKEKFQPYIEKIQANPKELANLFTMEEVKSLVINDQGETIISSYNKHLDQFLAEIN